MARGVPINFANFLQTVPAFAEFSPQELEVLEQAMVVGEYPDGYEFIGEERRARNMFLIVEGQVIATHRRSKVRGLDVMERLGPGDIFGLVALIDHRPGWATYLAAGPVTAAYLPANAFELLFTANAPLAYRFQSLIATQLVRDLRACASDLMAAIDETPKG